MKMLLSGLWKAPCAASFALALILPVSAQTVPPAPKAVAPTGQSLPPFGPGFLKSCNGKTPTPETQKFCQCYLAQVEKRYSKLQLQRIDSIVRSPDSGPNVQRLTAAMLAPERSACRLPAKP